MLTFEDLGFKTQNAKRYYTTCPKCDSTREHHKGARCVTINDEPTNRWWNCHHCGYSGNLDTEDKFDVVRDKAKMPPREKAFSIKAREYIQKRGLSVKTMQEFKIYESTAFDKVQLNFPFFMHYTLVNVKHLNTWWKKGDKGIKWYQLKLPEGVQRRILPFGIDKIKTHDDQGIKIPNLTVLIAEGEFDALTWFECEYKNVISVPQGAPSLKAKDFKKEFAWLDDPYVKSVLEHVDYFYLAADNDDAGKNLNKHLAMALGKEKCRIVQYPSGYKDINEVLVGNEEKKLKKLGKEGVSECYNNIASIPIKGVVKVAAIFDQLMQIREKGFEPGFGIGVPEVDHLFTLKRKLVAFITGVPGCFGANQKIHTKNGIEEISNIKEGDYVLCHNHSKKSNEFKRVLITHKFDTHNDKLFKITLKDGTIIKVTENHKFYYEGKYIEIKHIIDLWKNGK